MEKKKCLYCDGTGKRICYACDGKGGSTTVQYGPYVPMVMHAMPISMLETKVCVSCHGTGKQECIYCHGTGKRD